MKLLQLRGHNFLQLTDILKGLSDIYELGEYMQSQNMIISSENWFVPMCIFNRKEQIVQMLTEPHMVILLFSIK